MKLIDDLRKVVNESQMEYQYLSNIRKAIDKLEAELYKESLNIPRLCYFSHPVTGVKCPQRFDVCPKTCPKYQEESDNDGV